MMEVEWELKRPALPHTRSQHLSPSLPQHARGKLKGGRESFDGLPMLVLGLTLV